MTALQPEPPATGLAGGFDGLGHLQAEYTLATLLSVRLRYTRAGTGGGPGWERGSCSRSYRESETRLASCRKGNAAELTAACVHTYSDTTQARFAPSEFVCSCLWAWPWGFFPLVALSDTHALNADCCRWAS